MVTAEPKPVVVARPVATAELPIAVATALPCVSLELLAKDMLLPPDG